MLRSSPAALPFTLWLLVALPATSAEPDVSPSRITEALQQATAFMHGTIADHGGYAWVSSADGRYSNGEGIAGPDRVWVQPPGTPTIGAAFLDAYEVTGNQAHLDAALDAAQALLAGQLRSGGWDYSIPFAPADRKGIPFRNTSLGGADQIVETPQPGGWEIWRQREHPENQTIVDDDTTAAALRFLIRLDQQLEFENAAIHEAADYALRSVSAAQYPIGAWSHNYDRFPTRSPSPDHYPVLAASIPESWSRTWTKDFLGCYMLNDRITLDMIRTLWLAGEVYQQDRYRDAAIRGGEFLRLAQLPEPSPGWAQQYDRHMHPVWDRPFEPPAISGWESQDTLEVLLDLYQWTGEERFLEPIPRAVTYLRTCLRPDGNLARFYELGTNRPLYFNRDYELTGDDSEVPDHYGFILPSRLDAIQSRYESLREGHRESSPADPPPSADQIAAILQAQRADGAWTTSGFVRDGEGNKQVPEEGVVESQVFIDNMRALCDRLREDG